MIVMLFINPRLRSSITNGLCLFDSVINDNKIFDLNVLARTTSEAYLPRGIKKKSNFKT